MESGKYLSFWASILGDTQLFQSIDLLSRIVKEYGWMVTVENIRRLKEKIEMKTVAKGKFFFHMKPEGDVNKL